MDELKEFLEMNNIDDNSIMEAIHLDIRETILREVCERMKKDQDFYIKVKKLFFSNDDIEAVKRIVYSVCHCKIPQNDTLWMMDCIKAFLGKNDRRRAFSMEEKKEILTNQNYKCKICRCPIDLESMHVDHIIPWDYVGDKLENNLQGLCKECNLSKSNHVAITVTNIILHREA